MLLSELHSLDNLIAGSFFEREVSGTTRYCLSRMVEKKQRQVYISATSKHAVQAGVQSYQRALEILRELGEINLKLIREGIDLSDVR